MGARRIVIGARRASQLVRHPSAQFNGWVDLSAPANGVASLDKENHPGRERAQVHWNHRLSLDGVLGFSLIEVLVALMVLAVSLGGAIHVVAQSADMRSNLMDRTYAFWAAADAVNRLRLQGAWPAAGEKKSRYEDAAGRMWYGRLRVEETPDTEVRRVQLALSEKESAEALVRLVVYLRRPVT